MCLIAVKPAGVKAPSNHQLKMWFKEHPDGAGMAFENGDGRIHILKGALDLKSLYKMHRRMCNIIKPEKVHNINVMYHFRQATEGAVAEHNCHPFPLTSDTVALGSTDVICDSAIAHNGVIYNYATYKDGLWDYKQDDNTTDTQKFIEQYLAGMGDCIYNKSVGSLIAKHTSSKFAILSDNKITLIGQFIWDKGMYYSNYSYQESIVVVQKEQTPVPSYSYYDHMYGDTTNNSTGRFYHSGDMNKDSDHYKENYFNKLFEGDELVFCDNCGNSITYDESICVFDSLLCAECADYWWGVYEKEKGWR